MRRFNPWFSLSPIAHHAFVAILTGVSHYWSAWIRYPEGVKLERPNGWRWFEYSITATIMTMSGFVALGERNVGTYFLVAIAGVMIQYCGYFLERGPVRTPQNWRLSWKTFTECHSKIPECFKGKDKAEQNYDGDKSKEKIPKDWWHKYFLIAGMLQLGVTVNLIGMTTTFDNIKDVPGIEDSLIFYTIYYAFFPALAIFDVFYRDKGWYDFRDIDETYVLLSFTSKIALFFIVIGGTMWVPALLIGVILFLSFNPMFFFLRENVEINPSDWKQVRLFGMYFPLIVLGVYFLFRRVKYSEKGRKMVEAQGQQKNTVVKSLLF